MKLSSRDEGDVRVVALEESRLDSAGALEFKEQMRSLGAGGPRRVVLDMAQVQFLDSSGLGALVAVMKLLAPDARLEVAALSPAVAQVFALTKMDSVFTVHDSVQAALAAAPS
ncbi:Putative anti-sigma factor antagonist [Pseudoruegeria aquimaris]|uniref:Anti-sigma factor antagonist n=1 Tax=Pseudoruegeria aquimaris TaxID=393663 RepID=A0A1Y5TP10_9RHOB|nr:STAS domain-containing protein [Pseudoruegeria aquimaris]SLN68473.1 Putative anti-sigma factor antagonist [Pseudoruegeria aquimaris]